MKMICISTNLIKHFRRNKIILSTKLLKHYINIQEWLYTMACDTWIYSLLYISFFLIVAGRIFSYKLYFNQYY